MSELAATLKMILVGDAGVGKSALTFRYCDKVFLVDHVATLGVDFKYTVAQLPPSGQQVRLQIWDTAGQETFLTLTTAYYRGCHAAFICFDLTNRVSYESVPVWFERLREHAGDGSGPVNADPYATRVSPQRSSKASSSGEVEQGCNGLGGLLSMPCVLVGCKSDLADNETISMRQVSTAEAMRWASDHGIAYMETSSKAGSNVQDAFLYLASLAFTHVNNKNKVKKEFGGNDGAREFDTGLRRASLQPNNRKQLPGRSRPVKSLGGGSLTEPEPEEGTAACGRKNKGGSCGSC